MGTVWAPSVDCLLLPSMPQSRQELALVAFHFLIPMVDKRMYGSYAFSKDNKPLLKLIVETVGGTFGGSAVGLGALVPNVAAGAMARRRTRRRTNLTDVGLSSSNLILVLESESPEAKALFLDVVIRAVYGALDGLQFDDINLAQCRSVVADFIRFLWVDGRVSDEGFEAFAYRLVLQIVATHIGPLQTLHEHRHSPEQVAKDFFQTSISRMLKAPSASSAEAEGALEAVAGAEGEVPAGAVAAAETVTSKVKRLSTMIGNCHNVLIQFEQSFLQDFARADNRKQIRVFLQFFFRIQYPMVMGLCVIMPSPTHSARKGLILQMSMRLQTLLTSVACYVERSRRPAGQLACLDLDIGPCWAQAWTPSWAHGPRNRSIMGPVWVLSWGP
jgi:hypothetical protein